MIIVPDTEALLGPIDELVRWRAPATGLSSPLQVVCPQCRSYREDPCRRDDGGFCPERVRANLHRMLVLPTWAVPFETPCCKHTVWLCWRSAQDLLQWSGVPCPCGRTYSVQRHASDTPPAERFECDRLNPTLMEMTCWALQ